MPDISGSIKGVSLEGVAYRVAADANISRRPINIENSMVPTSGKAMRKIVKMVPQAEGVVLVVNPGEMDTIKALAESLDIIKLQITHADNSIYRSNGQIQIEAHESEENRANVTLLPEEDWTLFEA
jgi:hypothetical protein